MRVDRHVPVLGQFHRSADMIEVTVGEDDRSRSRLLAETRLGRLHGLLLRVGHAGVDQHPLCRSVGAADEIHVDDLHDESFDIGHGLEAAIVFQR